MNRKVKPFKETVFFIGTLCGVKRYKYLKCSLSALTPQSFHYLFIALSIIHYVVRSQPRNSLFVCQVATVVMEATQLILNQF